MGARRMSLPLWTGYGAAFLVAWFFSAGIFVRFPLMGSVPNLVPVCIVFVAVLEGSFAGSVFGLILGLFFWLTTGDGSMILLGSVIGMLAGLGPPHQGWVGCMLSALLALTAVNGVRLLAGGGSGAVMLRIAGAEMACSMLLGLLFCPIFRQTHRRWGGR